MAVQAQIQIPWIENHGSCGIFDESHFNLQQMQQQQSYLQHVSALKNSNNTFLLQSIVDKQRQELDRYISLQNESLRLVLQEQGKQEITLLIRKIEEKIHPLLKQKDQEIAKATNRTMELENFVGKLQIENQTWQRISGENEAMIVSLNNTIEQLKESNNDVEDAESCCNLYKEQEECENRVGFVEKQRTCKICNCRDSCVLFLPCRHLCSCQFCEAILDFCPVCKMEKKATIEILIF